MNQIKKCPFCAKAIKADAVACPWCDSDLSDSPSGTQADREPKKRRRFTIWHAGGLIIALLYLFLSDFLPEGVTQWVDWFMGKDKPFKPGWVLLLVIPLFVIIIGLIDGYFNPDDRASRGRPKLVRFAIVLIAAIGLVTALTIFYPDQPLGLVESARRNDVKQVRHLLDKGADVNTRDKDGMTALMWASFDGDVDVVRLLLNKGADVNATDPLGVTALGMASAKGHLQIVKLLVEKGADVNAKSGLGWTALMMASQCGHVHIVELLLEKGAYVNARDDRGETALMVASRRGNTRTAEILKAHGAKE